MGGEEQVEGVATVTSGGNDDVNDQLLILDVKRPALGEKNFVRFKVSIATQNAAFGAWITEQYLPRAVPVTQDATVEDIELINEPDAA